MVKATIQNSPYCTEMTFPCTETELLKNLDELGIDKEHLAPTGTVIDIEPAELSVLIDCEVNIDALNYLGKHMDGMAKLEEEQFLAVLSCDELNAISCYRRTIIVTKANNSYVFHNFLRLATMANGCSITKLTIII